jgi:hypothetical protein
MATKAHNIYDGLILQINAVGGLTTTSNNANTRPYQIPVFNFH